MFLVLLTVVFCDMNIAHLLSTLTLIGSFNFTFKNSKIPFMNKISLIISDKDTYSDSLDLVVTISRCLDEQDTKFSFLNFTAKIVMQILF